jgi:hypothetical protein
MDLLLARGLLRIPWRLIEIGYFKKYFSYSVEGGSEAGWMDDSHHSSLR